jgi:hypothetical protein
MEVTTWLKPSGNSCHDIRWQPALTLWMNSGKDIALVRTLQDRHGVGQEHAGIGTMFGTWSISGCLRGDGP